jgi:hypothetical protein
MLKGLTTATGDQAFELCLLASEPPGRRSAVALGAVRSAMSFALTGSLIGVV